MNLKALVLGKNVAALVTALRLQQHGFSVRIFELPDRVEPPATLPLLFHGPYEQTQLLFHEISTLPSLNTLAPVPLEFLSSSNRTTAFRPAFLSAPWHSITGFLRCSALPCSSRWKFLNYMEKIWEGVISLPPELHLQTAHNWLKAGEQNEEALRDFWNPLCLFLLNDHLEQTSAWSFIQSLKQHAVEARSHSTIRMAFPSQEQFFLSPLRVQIQQGGGTFIPFTGLPHFQMTGNHIEALSVNEDSTYRADVYVSTLSPFQLIDLLPERILARLGFFQQFNQLKTVPAVVVHGSMPESCPTPRLLLNAGPFNRLIWQPVQMENGPVSSRVICIALAKEELLSVPDEALRLIAIQEIQRAFPGFTPSQLQHLSSCTITRQSRAFITHAPGTMTFRPSHQTPIDDLFLAGYWTERNGTPEPEAAIQSAKACADLINTLALSRSSSR